MFTDTSSSVSRAQARSAVVCWRCYFQPDPLDFCGENGRSKVLDLYDKIRRPPAASEPADFCDFDFLSKQNVAGSTPSPAPLSNQWFRQRLWKKIITEGDFVTTRHAA